MTSEIARIESLIQSAEAFGGELHKADECADGITGIREDSRETAGSLRDVLYKVEAETTPRVLEMARRVFSGYGDYTFSQDIYCLDANIRGLGGRIFPALHPYNYAGINGESGIITIKATANYSERMTAVIHPDTTSICRKRIMGFIPRKNRVLIPSHIEIKFRHGQDGIELSNEELTPQEMFKIIADRYAAEGPMDYLGRCVEMYAKLPQLISRIGERLMQEEEKRKKGLEESMQKIERLAEGE